MLHAHVSCFGKDEKRSMKRIKGKILDGEQTVVLYNMRKNPLVNDQDIIRVDGRSFEVLRMETSWGNATAEVVELSPVRQPTHDREYKRSPPERYVVRLDMVKLTNKEGL